MIPSCEGGVKILKGSFSAVNHPAYVVTALLFSLGSAQPVMLSDSLSTTHPEFIVASEERVIFVNANGTLSSVSINEPFVLEPVPFTWEAGNYGWEGSEEITCMGISPDGNTLCLSVQVAVPDSIFTTVIPIPEPMIVLTSSLTDEDVKIMGIIESFRETKSFSFTQDSRVLFGWGFLPCNPTPEAFFAMHLGDETDLIQPYHLIDLEEGIRFSASGMDTHTLIANPWSDLAAHGNTITDMATLSTIYQDSTTTSDIIDQWIEPYIGLLTSEATQTARLADGTSYENPGENFIILCRVEEGRYIYSRDGGGTLIDGRIDWTLFEETESAELDQLDGYLSVGRKVLSANEGRGIVFSAGRGLYYYEL